MARFSLSSIPIVPAALRPELLRADAGGFCSFEGWVRDNHCGRTVAALEYEAYATLALREGETVLDEALAEYQILAARAAHRTGSLVPGDLAVWVGVSSAHREAAFAACRFIIDEIKSRVPIWKHEFYADGTDSWIDPTGTSTASDRRT